MQQSKVSESNFLNQISNEIGNRNQTLNNENRLKDENPNSK